MLSTSKQSNFSFVFSFFLFTSEDDVTVKLWREMGFWRRRHRQKPWVTSKEYSIDTANALHRKISNQRHRVPQACSYTVAMPQRQSENANSNLKPWQPKRDWQELQLEGCENRWGGLVVVWVRIRLRINLLNARVLSVNSFSVIICCVTKIIF